MAPKRCCTNSLQATDGIVESRVLSLMEGGSNARRIEALGVQVGSLGMARGAVPGPAALWQLRRMARDFHPDLVQGWMYHGNLAAWLAVRQCEGRPRLFWNLRQTLYDIRRETKMTRWLIQLGARLSPTADRIIYNSERSAPASTRRRAMPMASAESDSGTASTSRCSVPMSTYVTPSARNSVSMPIPSSSVRSLVTTR